MNSKEVQMYNDLFTKISKTANKLLETDKELMTTYTITDIPDLATARKDLCDDGTPYEGKSDQISQWAIAAAMNTFKEGDMVAESVLLTAISEAATQQLLDELVESGLLEAVWDEEAQDIVYNASKLS